MTLAAEFRGGWAAALACLIGHIIGLHTLPPYTIGLFIRPLQDAFGWSRMSISLGITILTICTAISAPVVGLLADRIDERILIATGMLVLAVGYASLATMAGSLTAFWATMALMALLGAGCSPVTLSRILVSLFDRHRGLAVGVTLIGTGLTGTLSPLVLGPIIEEHGWRAGYLAMAAIMVVCLPIVLLLLLIGNGAGAARRRSLRTAGPSPVAFSDILRQRPFTRLAMAFFCIAIATGGSVVHFVPMLVDAGNTAADAARMASLLGLSLVTGRLLTGIAMDHVFAPRLAVGLMTASAVGFLVLATSGPGALPYVALLVGMSLGAEIDLIVFLASRYFRMHEYGRAFGLLYSTFLVGVALSPAVYALLHDAAGSYSSSFVWAAGFLAVSAFLFLTLPRFAPRQA
jgi:MFS family permease